MADKIYQGQRSLQANKKEQVLSPQVPWSQIMDASMLFQGVESPWLFQQILQETSTSLVIMTSVQH